MIYKISINLINQTPKTLYKNLRSQTPHQMKQSQQMQQSPNKKMASDSSGNNSSIGSNYHYLFMKQFVAEIKKHDAELKDFVIDNVALQIVLGIDKYTIQQQKIVFYEIFAKLKNVDWVKKICNTIQDKLLTTARDLYQFQTQRNYFLSQNFRQTCNPPLSHSLPSPHLLNLAPLFKINLNKQLRRILWSKVLFTQQNKFQFFKYDHKIIPYNLREQLSIGMIRLWQENGLKIKENQKDCCLRLLQFIIKKWDRIPNKYQQALAFTVIDVYAHFTPSRISEIGAVFVGLSQVANFYFEQDINKRIQNLKLAFQLVDPQTYSMIQSCYLPFSESPSQLNQVFEHFRLTLSTSFFPLGGSQYIIDQILIKRRNKLDIYIIFSLLTMIMSDDLQKYKNDKMELTDIINSEKTKKTIKPNDVMDAFKVVYENVDVWHGNGDGKVLDKLKQFDNLYQSQAISGNGSINASKNVSLKLIQPPDDMAGFVIENKGPVLRLGTK